MADPPKTHGRSCSRRVPATAAGGALALISAAWLIWPSIRPGLSPKGRAGVVPHRVISVFVEDPQRVIAAVALWRRTPGATLVLQGRPGDQQVSRAYLEQRGLWPRPDPRLVVLTQGCDTVGQITALSLWLRRYPRPGQLTLVTSPAHLPRSLAIARIVVGSEGWRIQGLAARTGDNRPEQPWRRQRDQLRSQLWRLTGWNGNADLVCPARDRRLF